MTDNKERPGVNPADAAQGSGAAAPAAGEQREQYRKLIYGEFKEYFDEDVQNILRKRLKNGEETAKKLTLLSPALRVLAKKYGIGEDDAEALAAAILRDNDPAQREGQVHAQYEKWIKEAAEASDSYPEFQLEEELLSEEFRSLLKSGVPVKNAYELIHRQELLDGYTKQLEESITRRILAGSFRPKESAISGFTGAVLQNDAAHMSKNARREIIRRVQRGERIEL